MAVAPRSRPVLSLWAWVVMTPYFILQVNGIDASTRPADLPAGIAVAIEVDLALGVAFLVLGSVERLLGRWPAVRWAFVALALLGVAIGRPLLLTALQSLFGVDLAPTPMGARILVNLVVLTVASLALHFVVEGFARNLAARDRLLLIETDLELQATLTEAYRDEIMRRFRDETARPVLDALGRLFVRELPARALSD